MRFLHRLAGVTLVNTRPIPSDDILTSGCPWSISVENNVEITCLRKVLPISVGHCVLQPVDSRRWTIE